MFYKVYCCIKHFILCTFWLRNSTLIKFPFKRNGLPCCEDEPGSEKIALNVFVLYANERYTKLYSNKLKCINLTKYKTKDKSLSF